MGWDKNYLERQKRKIETKKWNMTTYSYMYIEYNYSLPANQHTANNITAHWPMPCYHPTNWCPQTPRSGYPSQLPTAFYLSTWCHIVWNDPSLIQALAWPHFLLPFLCFSIVLIPEIQQILLYTGESFWITFYKLFQSCLMSHFTKHRQEGIIN